MNILITGAAGFIATQIVSDLIASGYDVTCCVRNNSLIHNIFPNVNVICCDFLNDSTIEHWIPRLAAIDVVINCVGILYHPNDKTIWSIHYDTPKALFDACVTVGVKKIIQISALGIDQSETAYAKSKAAADAYLLTLPIPAIVLRPSLVYGRGSHGGSSLFRGLAGLPWVTPIPGTGVQTFQPIHLQDLSQAIKQMIIKPLNSSLVLHAVSSKQITLKELLILLRAWLGFAKSRCVYIPLWCIKLVSYGGDIIPYSIMNSTSYKMMIQNNITTPEETVKFHEFIGFVPRDVHAGIYSQPSTVQDHWHAKLYFLKPLLKFSIAFIWIFTASCSLFFYPKTASYQLLASMGIQNFWQPILLYSASIIDAGLGIAMLCSFQLKKIYVLQIIFILIYTILITIKLPQLWLEPFAPIAKNIPLLMCILVAMAMEP